MELKRFGAPWGLRVRLFTFLIIGTELAVVLALPFLVRSEGEAYVLWFVPLVMGLVLGATALFVVRRFELRADALVVKRSFWENRLPLSEITSAKPDPEALRGAWKTCGNDGLFAVHGRFRSKRLGKFQAFVTDPANAVVLQTTSGPVVVSPEDPSAFVHELERRQRQQESRV
jgi:hypothetical protein